jgi:hypothetical protein
LTCEDLGSVILFSFDPYWPTLLLAHRRKKCQFGLNPPGDLGKRECSNPPDVLRPTCPTETSPLLRPVTYKNFDSPPRQPHKSPSRSLASQWMPSRVSHWSLPSHIQLCIERGIQYSLSMLTVSVAQSPKRVSYLSAIDLLFRQAGHHIAVTSLLQAGRLCLAQTWSRKYSQTAIRASSFSVRISKPDAPG